ncbi:hypothetical protein PIB30_019185 [Stylosanthes scabra]|uniref:Uncharacterized protein n=1 Tax=Stylosanthes scabra TaxID=79078 RepID=A0ABU6Z4Y1_9FABA|nr:hypothetical protein [Stylosanthes scabra]
MPQNDNVHQDANGGAHFESNNQEQEEGPQNSNAHEGGTQVRPQRRHHARPAPTGQRILPGREEGDAPRIVVPRPNATGPNDEPDEYQYQSEELHSPPGSDNEDGPTVFPQHNPDTPYDRID